MGFNPLFCSDDDESSAKKHPKVKKEVIINGHDISALTWRIPVIQLAVIVNGEALILDLLLKQVKIISMLVILCVL